MDKRFSFAKWVALFFAFLILAISGTLAIFAGIHRHTFYPGVRIDEVAVGGLTYQAADLAIQKAVTSYQNHPVNVAVPDSTQPLPNSPNEYKTKEVVTTTGKLGVQYQGAEALAQAWQLGHSRPIQWLKDVWQEYTSPSLVHLHYTVSNQGIQDFIQTEVLTKVGAPVPAKLVIVNGVVTVTPPQPGLTVQKESLTKQIIDSFEQAGDGDTTYVQVPVSLIDSPISVKTVQPLADQWNALSKIKLSLTSDAGTITPSPDEILTWFAPVQDDKGTISLVLQPTVITAYVNGQGHNLDVAGSSTVLVNQLATLLTQKDLPTTETIGLKSKPKAVVSTGNYTLGEYEGKYVYVNLKDQRLYLIDGTTLVKAYIISSGAWATPTPLGEFTIHDKSPRAYSAAYGLYMPYWEDFLNGEYGLHELPEWPNGYKEGANHLGVPVSHGCVRLGVGDAKEVYDWTSVGTPVSIHAS